MRDPNVSAGVVMDGGIMEQRQKPDEWLKTQCNRYANGQCSTAACLIRGGYSGGRPDYDVATCEAHELWMELSMLRKAHADVSSGVVMDGGET
jgi:hypothetical protein